MLVREEPGGVVCCIGQQSHAWMVGQIARVWGNERFGPVVPREEVCLAAEQHDLAWRERDIEPSLGPDGRPRSFMEWGIEAQIDPWLDAPARLASQSTYAALLVSLHGHALLNRIDRGRLEPPVAERVRAFLDTQRELQHRLTAGLRADLTLAPLATDETIDRNRRLLWAWDSLSLAACLGWTPHVLGDVPTATGALDVTVKDAGGTRLTVDPWPFARDEVEVRCEARRLTSRYHDEQALRAAYAKAPPVTLRWTLRPALPVRVLR